MLNLLSQPGAPPPLLDLVACTVATSLAPVWSLPPRKQSWLLPTVHCSLRDRVHFTDSSVHSANVT